MYHYTQKRWTWAKNEHPHSRELKYCKWKIFMFFLCSFNQVKCLTRVSLRKKRFVWDTVGEIQCIMMGRHDSRHLCGGGHMDQLLLASQQNREQRPDWGVWSTRTSTLRFIGKAKYSGTKLQTLCRADRGWEILELPGWASKSLDRFQVSWRPLKKSRLWLKSDTSGCLTCSPYLKTHLHVHTQTKMYSFIFPTFMPTFLFS